MKNMARFGVTSEMNLLTLPFSKEESPKQMGVDMVVFHTLVGT